MNPFEFFTPTKVIFGRGMLSCVGEEAEQLGKKGLVVTDQGMVNTGLVGKVTGCMDEKGLNYLVWSDVVPNPRDTDIERGAAYAGEQGIDYLIAIGGGSAMDTAKAIGALLTNGGKCEDWYEGNLEKDIAPLLCIPTTCGTGSEVTHEAVINNTKTMEKDCIWGEKVNVRTAILDSEVLDGLPAGILSSTGMDALTHAVEAYVCKASSPLTDGLAIQSVRMIAGSLKKAVQTHDPEALDQMLAASAMAGMAFGNSDVASVHSISEALGGLYDIPHGVANAMMLAPVSRRSIAGAPGKYADIAEALGADISGMDLLAAAGAGVDYMQQLADELSIPRFSDLDVVDPGDFKRLARTAAAASETFDNPVLMDEEDFRSLFEELYRQ